MEGSTVSFEDLKLMRNLAYRRIQGLGGAGRGLAGGRSRSEDKEERSVGALGESAWSVLLQGTRRGPSSECVIIAFRGSAIRISSLPGSLVLLQSLFLIPPLPPSTAHTGTELRGFPEKMKSFLQDLRTTHKPGT